MSKKRAEREEIYRDCYRLECQVYENERHLFQGTAAQLRLAVETLKAIGYGTCQHPVSLAQTALLNLNDGTKSLMDWVAAYKSPTPTAPNKGDAK